MGYTIKYPWIEWHCFPSNISHNDGTVRIQAIRNMETRRIEDGSDQFMDIPNANYSANEERSDENGFEMIG